MKKSLLSAAEAVAARASISAKITETLAAIQRAEQRGSEISAARNSPASVIDQLVRDYSNAMALPAYKDAAAQIAELDKLQREGEAELEKLDKTLEDLRSQLRDFNVAEGVLREALNECQASLRKIESLEGGLEAAQREFAEKIALADLSTDSDLDHLGRLRTRIDLLPRQIEACRATAEKAEAGLLDLANHFISTQLGPKRRTVEAKARDRVAKSLRELYSPDELDRAVSLSAVVREASAFDLSIASNPIGGAIAHAERVLNRWEAVEAFEASLK